MEHQIINSVKGSHSSGIIYTGDCWDYHFHNSFEIIYVLEGELRILINNETVQLKQKRFLLIAPGMVHAIKAPKDSRFFIGIFTADYVMEFYQKDLTAPFYVISVPEAVEQYFVESMITSKPKNRYLRKSCLYAICACVVEAPARTGGEKENVGFVVAVNQYISEHFTQDIRRQDIAAALNYEEHYFSSLFHKTFDIGLRKYLNIYRFALSQRLLRTTEQSIGQIALDCGFSSVRAFNDVFKDLAGMTPGKYRKQK